MKYVISFYQTVQVSEDHWERRLRTFSADDSTTIGKVRAWYAIADKEKDRLREPLIITEAEDSDSTDGR